MTGSSGTAFTALVPQKGRITSPLAESQALQQTLLVSSSLLLATVPAYGGATQPNTPSFWAAYVDADAELYIASAPDACTGRTSNIGIIQAVRLYVVIMSLLRSRNALGAQAL